MCKFSKKTKHEHWFSSTNRNSNMCYLETLSVSDLSSYKRHGNCREKSTKTSKNKKTKQRKTKQNPNILIICVI